MSWGHNPITASPKTGWRQRGYEDGFAGRPHRVTPDDFRSVYLEGYRAGVKTREQNG